MSPVWSRIRAALPHGIPLPEDVWRRRHRVVLTLLWVQVPFILGLAWLGDEGLLHGLAETAPIAGLAAVAGYPALGRTVRSGTVTLGLVACSAVFVHLSGGLIETHFHFFAVVTLIVLYQQWLPFLLALGFVVVHHGVLGTLEPAAVFNHPAAVANPWTWALVHGVFVLLASIAGVILWKRNEELRSMLDERARELEEARAEMEVAALTDALTKLPNRPALTEILRRALARGRRAASYVAVLFIDVDGFKEVNDTLGHAQGDALLVAVARRLQRSVRPGDAVARHGGDEFIVVCEPLRNPQEAASVAARVGEAFHAPLKVSGLEIDVTVSIGIAVSDPGKPTAPESLIMEADEAMYEAKGLGRNRFVAFDKGLSVPITEDNVATS